MKLMNVERIEGSPVDTLRFRFQGEKDEVTAVFAVDLKTKAELGPAELHARAKMKAYAALIGSEE